MIAEAHSHSACVWRYSDRGDQRGRWQAMRASWRRTFAVVGVAAMLEACAFPSGTTYSPSETGAVMRVEPAQVVSSREVVISGLDNSQAAGWGTVVGGLAGLAAEERRETRRSAEYILRDQGGETIAVVQSLGSGEGTHQPGAEVSLIYGSRDHVRVVPVQT